MKEEKMLCRFAGTVAATALIGSAVAAQPEGPNTYSLHSTNEVFGELHCAFHDVRDHAYGIWWSVTGEYVDDNGIYDRSSNGWRVQARVALDSLSVVSGEISCAVGFVANMKMRQLVDLGLNQGGGPCLVTRLVGSKRKVFQVARDGPEEGPLPSFLAKSEELARGDVDGKVLMCASGMDYFFEGQDFLQYALFLTGCETLVFTYAIGLEGEVKAVRWELHDGCVADNIELGTVSLYDSRYSVSVRLRNPEECINRRTALDLTITLNASLKLETVMLPISLWNVKTLCDSLKSQKSGGVLKWSADRDALGIDDLVF